MQVAGDALAKILRLIFFGLRAFYKAHEGIRYCGIGTGPTVWDKPTTYALNTDFWTAIRGVRKLDCVSV